MPSLRRIAACAAAILLAPLAACGSDAVHNKDYGQPPDSGFDPGRGGAGDGYGSGSNSGPFDAGPPVCPAEYKRCASDFAFPYGGETSVELRGDYKEGGWEKGDPMVRVGSVWTVSVTLPFDKDVQYKFVRNGDDWVTDPNNPKTVTTPGGVNSLRSAKTCEPAICEEPGPLPPGVFDWRDSVIYFVFVDRFLDADPSNNCTTPGAEAAGQYQGGDWKGVTQKINEGYFTGLGINTLWVTVPVKNTGAAGRGVGGDNHMYSGYHGYWPSDLEKAESCFGTKVELKALVDAAHAKGIKVLFDYAMVHVHVDSPIYAAHRNDEWFYPNTMNGQSCICGSTACPWETQGDRCWFTDYLPHWNYGTQAARDYSVGNAVQWVKEMGIDGYRLDAIKHVDGRWLTDLRAKITSDVLATQSPKQRFYMVGETYDFGNRDYLKSFVDPARKLDGQFDFPLRNKLLRTIVMRQAGMDELASFVSSNDNFYGTGAVMSTWVGNHDVGRAIHMAEDSPLWGDANYDGKNVAWSNQPQLPTNIRPFERMANAFAFLLTSKGAPLVYYGDEIGLPGAGDPDNRRKMTWGTPSAEQQYLFGRIKTFAKIRADHPALRRGQRQTLDVKANAWLYTMSASGDVVYVAINRGDSEESVSGLPNTSMKELVTGGSASGPAIKIPPRQTRVFVAP